MGYSRKTGAAALPLPYASTQASDIAEALTNVSGALGNTQVVELGGELETWLGQAATAYSHEATVIQSRVGEAQGALANASSALTDYQSAYDTLVNTTIPDYQEQWDEAIRIHDENVESYETQRQQARNDAVRDGYEADTSEFDRLIQEEHDALETNQDELARFYNTSVNEVNDIADEKAGLVASSIDGLVPRDIATGGGDPFTPNRNNIGVSLFGDEDLIGGNARWEDANEDVEEAINLLNTTDDRGVPTEEAMAEFNDKFGDRMANDPFFATAFASSFPPEQLLELGADLSVATSGYSQEYIETFTEFQANIGAGMMVATGSEPANGSNSAWRVWQDSNSGLIVDGDTGYTTWRTGYLNDLGDAAEGSYGDNEYPGYLYLGHYIGIAAEEYEGLALSDAFLNEGGTGSLAHQIVQHRHEGTINYNNLWGYPPTGSNDPLHNMLLAMDGNPEATNTFLASNTGFDYGNDNQNMTAYLVGHVQGYYADHVWLDEGLQLGIVIDEATSMPDAREHSETFQILNGFLDGYTDGLERDQTPGIFGGSDKVGSWWGTNEGDGQDYFGRDNAGLRHMAGSILEEYTSDLAREIRTPSGEPGANPYMMSLDSDGYTLALSRDLKDALIDGDNGFFMDLSYDTPPHPGDGATDTERTEWANQVADSALGKISTAAATEMRVDLTQARIEGNPAFYNDAAGDYGTFLSHLEMADYHADVAQGIEADSRNSTVRSSIDFATDLLPWKKIPGFSELPDAVQTAIKQGQSGSEDMAFNEWLSVNNADDAKTAREEAWKRSSTTSKMRQWRQILMRRTTPTLITGPLTTRMSWMRGENRFFMTCRLLTNMGTSHPCHR